MRSGNGDGDWLAFLEAELARRAARVEWQAGEEERAAQRVIEELQQMAARFMATMHLYPLDLADMSLAEKLACRLFLPEHLRPSGLPTEDEIWVEFQARSAG